MLGRVGLLVSALASTLLVSPSAFAAGPFGTIHVGYWQGGAYKLRRASLMWQLPKLRPLRKNSSM
jgi:hypothetical protein